MRSQLPARHEGTGSALYVRELNVLDTFLLVEDPFGPLGVAVRHAAQDDLRDLQARVAETN